MSDNNMIDRTAMQVYERNRKEAQCRRLELFIRLITWICVIGIVAAIAYKIGGLK